jgi:peptidoglycan/xylan/chitin deacetylase (PgdA/CDA1 family)
MTPAILNILEKHNVKATFFILGEHLAAHEAIVRQIAAAGHEIGAHGYEHFHSWKVSPFRPISDIKRAWEAIDRVLGTDRGVYAYRPPYGKLNLVSLLYLLVRKASIVLWTADSGDRTMSKTNPSALRSHDTQRLALDVREMGGAVVLAHDTNRRNPDTEAFTLESVRALLVMANETGIKTMTVSELLGRGK